MNEILVGLLEWGALPLAVVLFVVLSVACEIGYRFGHRGGARRPASGSDHTITATLTSGMVALLAFVLGLSVNYAQGRFEARRDLVVTEANAVGTAWLRAKLIGGAEGEAIAAGVRDYGQTRLEFTRAAPGERVEALNERAAREETVIWKLAADLAIKKPTPITATLVNALNEMFDSAQSQRFAFLSGAPGAMLDMMMLGSIIAIGAMGYEMGAHGTRQLVLSSLLLVMWTGAMVMTVDLSRARVGLVRVDPAPLEWTLHDIDSWPATAPAPTTSNPP